MPAQADAAGIDPLPGIQLPDDFCRHGIAVLDAFLSPDQTAALRESATRRRARGEFVEARIGGRQAPQRRADIRGDSTCWWDEPLTRPERLFVQAVEGLRLTLNSRMFLGLFDVELHYAWYPAGSGYARHVDQPQGSGRRRVSFVLYLNDVWDGRDGGELRLFDADGGHRDVAPLGGRLVCFLTEGREHGVLTTRRPRLSVTGWFLSRS